MSWAAIFDAPRSPASSRSKAITTRGNTVFLERRQVIGREALHAISRRHVAIARDPERRRVDQRLASG